MNWRIARTLGLWGLVLGAGAMLIIMALAGQWIWFTVFSVISATILIAEVYSYFFTPEHITISTRYGRWIKTNPVSSLIALGLFIFAMLSLCLHLWGYAFK